MKLLFNVKFKEIKTGGKVQYPALKAWSARITADEIDSRNWVIVFSTEEVKKGQFRLYTARGYYASSGECPFELASDFETPWLWVLLNLSDDEIEAIYEHIAKFIENEWSGDGCMEFVLEREIQVLNYKLKTL